MGVEPAIGRLSPATRRDCGPELRDEPKCRSCPKSSCHPLLTAENNPLSKWVKIPKKASHRFGAPQISDPDSISVPSAESRICGMIQVRTGWVYSPRPPRFTLLRAFDKHVRLYARIARNRAQSERNPFFAHPATSALISGPSLVTTRLVFAIGEVSHRGRRSQMIHRALTRNRARNRTGRARARARLRARRKHTEITAPKSSPPAKKQTKSEKRPLVLLSLSLLVLGPVVRCPSSRSP